MNPSQYHIPREVPDTSATKKDLKQVGMMISTLPPFDSPLWPVWKTDRSWSMAVDSQVMPLTAAAVPDVVSFLEQIIMSPGASYATIDLSNAFFSTSVHKDHQAIAFHLARPAVNLYYFTSRRYNSPVQCYNLVHRNLESFSSLHGITVVHYTDLTK